MRGPGAGICFALALLSSSAHAQCVLPYNIQNGEPTDASKVMANYNALLTCVNAVVPGGALNAVQYNAGNGAFGGAGPLTDGQILIGLSGGPPQAASVTAGQGIQVTNGPGEIQISADGSVAVDSGLYRQVMSETPTVVSTGLVNWINKGSATINESDVGLSVRSAGSSNTNTAVRSMAAPTPPYKISALVSATRNSSSYSTVGLGWYDGSSKLHVFGYSTSNGGPSRFSVSRLNSPTSWNSDDFSSQLNGFAQPIWMQIADDGASLSFAFSQDGANYLTLYSVLKSAAWLGVSGYSNVIFTVNPEGGETVGTLMSWRVE